MIIYAVCWKSNWWGSLPTDRGFCYCLGSIRICFRTLPCCAPRLMVYPDVPLALISTSCLARNSAFSFCSCAFNELCLATMSFIRSLISRLLLSLSWPLLTDVDQPLFNHMDGLLFICSIRIPGMFILQHPTVLSTVKCVVSH
jgi:hypothetical protein